MRAEIMVGMGDLASRIFVVFRCTLADKMTYYCLGIFLKSSILTGLMTFQQNLSRFAFGKMGYVSRSQRKIKTSQVT